MSGIGSVTSSNSELLRILLLQQTSTLQSSNSTDASSVDQTGASNSGTATDDSKGLKGLMKQIEQAVAAALASLDKLAGAQQVMDTIKNAIDSTVKANGVSLGFPAGGSGAPSTGQADAAGAKRPSGPPPAGGPGGGMGALLDKLLEENGFDPEKIKSELQQARTDTASSATGASATMMLILQLPANSGVDAQA